MKPSITMNNATMATMALCESLQYRSSYLCSTSTAMCGIQWHCSSCTSITSRPFPPCYCCCTIVVTRRVGAGTQDYSCTLSSVVQHCKEWLVARNPSSAKTKGVLADKNKFNLSTHTRPQAFASWMAADSTSGSTR